MALASDDGNARLPFRRKRRSDLHLQVALAHHGGSPGGGCSEVLAARRGSARRTQWTVLTSGRRFQESLFAGRQSQASFGGCSTPKRLGWAKESQRRWPDQRAVSCSTGTAPAPQPSRRLWPSAMAQSPKAGRAHAGRGLQWLAALNPGLNQHPLTRDLKRTEPPGVQSLAGSG